MGRHADTAGRRGRLRVSISIVAIVVVVACAIGLGLWWWHLKSATDPIDANPVDAYGLVISSPSCTAGAVTVVKVSGTNPAVTANLNACGYRVGERLPVQYLAGHPETVRLTGTSTAQNQSMTARLLPIGILAAGLIAVLATIALLVDRRRSRHQATSSRAARSVAVAPAWAAMSGVGMSRGSAPPSVPVAPDAPSVAGGSSFPGIAPSADPGTIEPGAVTGSAEVFSSEEYGTGYGAGSLGVGATVEDGVGSRPEDDPVVEPAAALADSVLFTHANPDPIIADQGTAGEPSGERPAAPAGTDRDHDDSLG